MRIRIALFSTIVLVFAILSIIFAIQLAEHYRKIKLAPLFDNLSQFNHSITTKSPLAQRYFNQGLILFYSFEYGEAIRSFKAAIKADPNCAMCYWGLALALGSKTDMPLTGHELVDAQKNIHFAMQKVDKLNLSESLYIAALAQRYIETNPQKMDEFAGLCSSYSAVSGNSAEKYAIAMKKLLTFFPNDGDAKTLYAASLFDLSKWDFWDTKGNPKKYTEEIIEQLESAMTLDTNNAGANHLYVHIIEGSRDRAKALPNAKRLSALAPDSEHLAHMPCHTYYSVGRYHEATEANQNAIRIYKNYVSQCRAQGFKPETQYLNYHNYDYLVVTASMEGRKKLSIDTADELAKLVAPQVKKNPLLQKMLTNKLLMRLHFGEWEELSKIPAPSPQHQYALGIWYYTHGIAKLKQKKINGAKHNLRSLHRIINQGPVKANLNERGFTLLKIAEHIFEALLAESQKQYKPAILHLKNAIKLQDTLISADPPPWYLSVRQVLGMLLLKAKNYSEALTMFEEELKLHPNNGWALYGLEISLKELGKIKEAQSANKRFKEAWRYSDIPVPISLL